MTDEQMGSAYCFFCSPCPPSGGDITQCETEGRYITSYQMAGAVNSQPIRELQFAMVSHVPIKKFQGQHSHRKKPFDCHLFLSLIETFSRLCAAQSTF
ncbi:unnamed protein product [Arctogadus glacialis]